MTQNNPDNKTTISTGKSLGISIAFSFICIWAYIVLFMFKNTLSSVIFNILLWFIIPVICYISSISVNVINQLSTCGTINIGSASLFSLITFGIVYIFTIISSISYCRIPIISAIAPSLTGITYNVTSKKKNSNTNYNSSNISNSNNSNSCNSSKNITLEMIESKLPSLQGISYGFYVFFGMLFGNVISTGLSINC